LINLSPSENKDYSLWKVTKRLKTPLVRTPPLKIPQDEWARSVIEKAAVFAQQLADQFKPLKTGTDLPHTLITGIDPVKLFTPHEIAKKK